MNTTQRTLTALALMLGIAVLGVIGCSKQESTSPPPATDTNTVSGQTSKVQYTCPMHSEVVQDGAGKCPKCGMNLVVKK